MIPYEAIGKTVALFLGVWSFIIAEDGKERAIIAGIMISLLLVKVVFSGSIVNIISLLGWIVFGLGCVINLRLKGVLIR